LRNYIFYKQTVVAFFILLSFHISAQIPSGYYSTATGTGVTLKTQLYNIIKNHTTRTYDQLWTDFNTTDKKPDGKVWDIYTDIPSGTPVYTFTFSTNQCGSYSVEGDCYNREHSFPKSWFGVASGAENSVPMGTDLFHLYPTDGKVNAERSNYPYGKVGTASYTSSNGSKLGNCTYSGYTGTVFEPIDEYKGDLARTYFYMATRYENLIASWEKDDTNGDVILNGTSFPAYETWFLNMLGEWSVADPVSQKEIDRNNAIYALQGNRNPFIDHPEYVYSVWGVGNVGSSLAAEPTNYPANFLARRVKLQWVDATGATVPQHYLIRMSITGFSAIAAPVDGTAYANSANDLNVDYGVQQARFYNLNAGTYYLKLYGYTGSGATADYKTDGTIPQLSVIVP
jgi:endonuclease I